METPVKIMKVIWPELLCTLKGQCDKLQGTLKRKVNLRVRFKHDLGVYKSCNGEVKWNFNFPLLLLSLIKDG